MFISYEIKGGGGKYARFDVDLFSNPTSPYVYYRDVHRGFILYKFCFSKKTWPEINVIGINLDKNTKFISPLTDEHLEIIKSMELTTDKRDAESRRDSFNAEINN